MSADETLEQIADSALRRSNEALAGQVDFLNEQVGGLRARLDSHTRVMESIVRRVRVLEGGGGDAMARLIRAEEQQDKAERAAVESYNRRCQLDLELGAMRDRAETAERERDEQRRRADAGWEDSRLKMAGAESIRARLREANEMYEASHRNFMAMAQDRDERERERDAALAKVERLRKYVAHSPSCVSVDCNCGLTAALEDA